MPLDPRQLVVVTGGNSKFFLHVVLLAESFAHHCGGTLKVCDYGMNEAERIFLERRGWLIPAPAPIDAARHAWYYKATLIDYLRAAGDGTPWPEGGGVLWLDADAVVVDDIVSRLLTEAGDPPNRRSAYACLEKYCDFNLIFEAVVRKGKAEVRDAYRDRFGITGDHPYVSSGIFMVFDPGILTRWKEIVWSELPGHFLFEQNAFNVALKDRDVGWLDTAVHNVTQWELLRCKRRVEDGAMLTEDGQRVSFLHMTANGEGVLFGEKVIFRVPQGILRLGDYILRRPDNPDIRLIQEAFLSRIVRKYGEELLALGLAQLDPPDSQPTVGQ